MPSVLLQHGFHEYRKGYFNAYRTDTYAYCQRVHHSPNRKCIRPRRNMRFSFLQCIPLWRKCIIIFATSWTMLTACFSSTSLISVSKEISEDLNTTNQTVILSTAGLILAMGMSTLVWSSIATVSSIPGINVREVLTDMDQIVGRRVAYLACITVLFGLTVCTAVAPTIVIFVIMRILSGLQGTLSCCRSNYHCRVLHSRTAW